MDAETVCALLGHAGFPADPRAVRAIGCVLRPYEDARGAGTASPPAVADAVPAPSGLIEIERFGQSSEFANGIRSFLRRSGQLADWGSPPKRSSLGSARLVARSAQAAATGEPHKRSIVSVVSPPARCSSDDAY
jgi:hypothetical protein